MKTMGLFTRRVTHLTRMKKMYVFLLIFSMAVIAGQAQLNYSFNVVSKTYTPISGGTTATLVAATSYDSFDEGYANNLPIGFTFKYNGKNYSSLHVNTNGFAAFDKFTPIENESEQAYWYNTLALRDGAFGPHSIRPVLAPLWDDLLLADGNSIKYITTGTTPNRVFTVEWNKVYWDWGAEDPCIAFQIKLYETSNIVEFHYKHDIGAVSTDGASIGISAEATGTTNFLSLNLSTSTPTVSSTVTTDNISIKPASGQVYRFSPSTGATPVPVALSLFAGEKKKESNWLKWVTQTEQLNKGFELERSGDGINFRKVAFIPSKASDGNSTAVLEYSFEDRRPLVSNNYYRLKQVDLDGKSTYSGVVILKRGDISRLQLGAVFPNPATSSVNVVVAAPARDRIHLAIIDMSGKTVWQQNTAVEAGNNELPVNVSKLTAGTYLIKVISANSAETAVTNLVKK